VDRILHQEGRECVAERQTIIYRGAQAPIPDVSGGVKGRVKGDIKSGGVTKAGEELWTPGAVDLFRFSAATFNSHRIHYDLPYARDVEGYPQLVVQGPLTAAKLFAFASARRPTEVPARAFECRALAPLFAGLPVRLAAGADPGSVEAVRCDETIAMSGRLE
jgi:3-methylfumaryl-CoA hydratase